MSWSLTETERAHAIREAVTYQFALPGWMLRAALSGLEPDAHGVWSDTVQPMRGIDHGLLRMRGGLAKVMPGVEVR